MSFAFTSEGKKKGFRNYIWLMIVATLIGCSKNLDVCEKYLEKDYINANLQLEKLYDEGKIAEAISVANEMVKKDSNNYIAINYLGLYKYELCKQSECSVDELKEIYELNEKSIELCGKYRIGYFNIIQILSELSKTKYQNDYKIIEYLQLYNSRYKKRSNLLVKGGQAMFRLGRIEEALRYLDEAIELDSTEAMAYIFKAKCYVSQNKWDKAIEFLNHGLLLDSLSLGFHERGYVNKELGNIDEAIRDYNIAISLYDERFESYVGLGQIEIERNDIDLACQYFNMAKQLKPENEIIDVWMDKYCRK